MVFESAFERNHSLKQKGRAASKQLHVCTKRRGPCLRGKERERRGVWGRGQASLTTPSGFPHSHAAVTSVLPVSSQCNTQQKRSQTFPRGVLPPRGAGRPPGSVCLVVKGMHSGANRSSSFLVPAIGSSCLRGIGLIHVWPDSRASGLWSQTDLDSGCCHLLTWERLLTCDIMRVTVCCSVSKKRPAGRRQCCPRRFSKHLVSGQRAH